MELVPKKPTSRSFLSEASTYGLACSGDGDNHRTCHITVYCFSLKMRHTCGNAQGLFVCSLSRLSPVVNRNGRKDSDTTLTRIMQGICKQGLYKIITETTGAGELSKDCHKSLSIKEGVSYFPFDCAMCKFITDLFFTNVGLVLTVCLRAKQIIHFRNDTEKEMFELLCAFLGLLFVPYT